MSTLGSYNVDSWSWADGGTNYTTLTSTAEGHSTFSSTGAGTTVRVSGVTDPVLSQDAATKNYVDFHTSAGITWKDSVNAASTANVVLSPAGTVDGFTPTVVGERALLKDQTTSTEIGIYTYDGADWVRATDAPITSAANGDAVFAFAGTANNDTFWVVTNDTSINWGTVGVTLTQFGGSTDSAGASGDVQYSDGSGGFVAATTSDFNFTDGATSTLAVGAEGGGFIMNGQDATTAATNGSGITLFPGDGNTTGNGGSLIALAGTAGATGSGGNVNLTAGPGGATSGDGGNVTIQGGDGPGTGDGGDVIVRTGDDASTSLFQVQDSSATLLFSIDGTGQGDFVNNLDVSGGVDIDADNVSLTVGAGADWSVSHDGTDTTMTSTTGDLVIDNTSATGDTVVTLGTDDSATNFLVEGSGGTTRLGVDGAGLVTITNSTNSTSKDTGALVITDGGLGVEGDVYATSHKSVSDVALKTNIYPLGSALDTLLKIKPYEYNWKKDPEGQKVMGVLANQLEEIGLNDLVTNGTHKSVDYLQLIPLLIAALQEYVKG